MRTESRSGCLLICPRSHGQSVTVWEKTSFLVLIRLGAQKRQDTGLLWPLIATAWKSACLFAWCILLQLGTSLLNPPEPTWLCLGEAYKGGFIPRCPVHAAFRKERLKMGVGQGENICLLILA